ncbi:MAG: type II secretion system protein GspK [Gammaproteobacteria bacterium]|nr:type II secretion system protein GspK [Gammaproteobacteria bacterium]
MTSGLSSPKQSGLQPSRLLRRPPAKGSVLIIVLWTAVLLTVLVTAMASKVRLSAQTVIHHQEVSTHWPELMSAVSHAEMELMLELMSQPIDFQPELTAEGELRNPRYRFNGRALDLHYPQPADIVVRIYDHGGKINLNRIPRRNMQSLIENRLGGLEADPRQVQELLAAWTDWTDLNDLEGLDGAESDYYQSLDQPYMPRNNPELDTVHELLHVRGFAELFAGVNLDAAFTVYGNERTINLNLATREAMDLLPGMTPVLIENVIAYRQLEDISNRADVAEIIPFENLQELSPWIGNNTSQVFSIFAYPAVEVDQETLSALEAEQEFINPDPVTRAYMAMVEVRSFSNSPRVYKIDPYGRIPDTAPARLHPEDYLFPY